MSVTEAVVVPEPEVNALSVRAEIVANELRAIEVVDQETYDLAASRLRDIAGWKAKVVEFFKPLKDQAFKLHRTICDREKTILAPVEGAEREVRQSLGNWAAEQERIRREQERIAAEENRKLEEKQRADAIAEAKALGASDEAAKAIAAEVPALAPPAIPPTFQRAQGVATRRDWKWRPKGSDAAALKALVRAAAKDDRLLGYLALNTVALNGAARGLKSAASIPGIEVYPVASVSVRS